MGATPINLAMLRIILNDVTLDDAAHIVAVQPDGTEHPVVAARLGLDLGRMTFRLHLAAPDG